MDFMPEQQNNFNEPVAQRTSTVIIGKSSNKKQRWCFTVEAKYSAGLR
jgi:hypothetical protein